MKYYRTVIELANGQQRIVWPHVEPWPSPSAKDELIAVDMILEPIEAGGCPHVTQVREYIERRLTRIDQEVTNKETI
jgi:hypothetical protein